MTEKNYISINSDGSVDYVTERRSQRRLSDDVIAIIGSKSPKHLRNVFESNGDPVGLIGDSSIMFGYKFQKVLKLNCTFKVTGDSILRPIFISEGQKLEVGDAYPQFVAEWKVPASMRLMFAAKIKNLGSGAHMTDYNHGCMLIAWLGRVAYRLPLPNLYDNCDMCTGKFDGMSTTMQGAFQKADDQMEKSSWNSDLLDEVRQRNADEMFQFKPMPDGSMVSLPCPADWKRLCPSAGSTNIEILAGAL